MYLFLIWQVDKYFTKWVVCSQSSWSSHCICSVSCKSAYHNMLYYIILYHQFVSGLKYSLQPNVKTITQTDLLSTSFLEKKLKLVIFDFCSSIWCVWILHIEIYTIVLLLFIDSIKITLYMYKTQWLLSYLVVLLLLIADYFIWVEKWYCL